MAGLAHNQLYSNEPQTPLHWHKRLCEGEDDLVLDDHILDSHTYDMAAAEHVQRRESFASSASLVSPTQHAWPEFAYNPEATSNYPMNNNTTSLFPENGGSHFPHPDAPQFAHYGNHMAPWQQQANPGPDSTTAAFNTFASDLETIKPEAPYNGDMVSPQHANNVCGGLPVQMDSEYSQYPTSAASPQWSTSSSDAVEKIPRSGHFQSPMFNHNPPHLRRDGVRKKNARFDIPEGRNLQTIDELINSTNPSNEEEIKELKQQKRLLRNRQAALDSRCRKKHHTEKLEEEKKHFIAVIDQLEDDIRNLRMNEQRWLHERQQWHQYSENLAREKEELVRQHTLETADLRRKNTYLVEEAQRFDGTAMSAQPSSTGVSAGFPEFEHLNMDSSPFDDFSFVDNPAMEMETKQETSIILQPKRESPTPTNSEDKSAASGLLLMLLLCGAWVASKNTTSASVAIPRMPDDVRVASAVVLENIYKDAGLQSQMASQSKIENAAMGQAGPTRASGNSGASTSSLTSLHHDLTSPSREQQRDQAFSLTAGQYSHITSEDIFDQQPKPSQAPRRRNLGETLAAMRAQKQGPSAEVYTRSLMLDKVPADVVRDFARMMEENKGGEPLN